MPTTTFAPARLSGPLLRGIDGRYVLELFEEESHLLKLDLRDFMDGSETVSSATWTVEDGDITIASASVSTPVVQASVTNTSQGGRFKVAITTSTAQEIRFLFRVIQPASRREIRDYGNA